MGATPLAPLAPTPVFHSDATLSDVDGIPTWVWFAEHCGEVFAMGEEESAGAANLAASRAIHNHARRLADPTTCEAQTDADLDRADDAVNPRHPFAE